MGEKTSMVILRNEPLPTPAHWLVSSSQASVTFIRNGPFETLLAIFFKLLKSTAGVEVNRLWS